MRTDLDIFWRIRAEGLNIGSGGLVLSHIKAGYTRYRKDGWNIREVERTSRAMNLPGKIPARTFLMEKRYCDVGLILLWTPESRFKI